MISAFVLGRFIPLSKPYLRRRHVLDFVVIFTMLFSGGTIPTLLVVDAVSLMHSLWALVPADGDQRVRLRHHSQRDVVKGALLSSVER